LIARRERGEKEGKSEQGLRKRRTKTKQVGLKQSKQSQNKWKSKVEGRRRAGEMIKSSDLKMNLLSLFRKLGLAIFNQKNW
jgi:hypothetical protein